MWLWRARNPDSDMPYVVSFALSSRLELNHKLREVWIDPTCLSTGIQVALSFRFTYDHVNLLLRVQYDGQNAS
jgi:hypothetical protein